MKSAVFTATEIDDAAETARSLAEGVLGGFPLLSNSVGLLFSYSDMDLAGLAAELGKLLPFEVLGCSTVGTMDRRGGYRDMAATLTVLTADDCAFFTACSGPVTAMNAGEETEDAYRRLAGASGKKPGLLFAFPPFNPGIMLDEYPRALARAAPGVPLIGGLPSCGEVGDPKLCVHGGAVYRDRLVMLAITGNVKPVFAVRGVEGNPVERKRRVTESKNNVVRRVGNRTFTEYLEAVGMDIGLMTAAGSAGVFGANPLFIEQVGPDGEKGYAFARILCSIDPAEGSGTAVGEIPEGAILSVCPLHREEVVRTARACVAELREKIAALPGYGFSIAVAVSCIARHHLLSPNSGAEADSILSGFPEGIAFSGFYSLGELGPLAGPAGTVNFAHNESLALCAF